MAARARRDDAASPSKTTGVGKESVALLDGEPSDASDGSPSGESAAQGLVTAVGPEPFGAGPCGDSQRAPSRVKAPSSMAVAEQLVITGCHTEAGPAAAIVRGFSVLLTAGRACRRP